MKNVGPRAYIFTILAVFFLFSAGYSQKKDKTPANKGKGFTLTDSTGHGPVSEWQLSFPNLEKVPFYYNEEELARLKKLEAKKDYLNLMLGLEQYVRQFGIQNFSRNTSMIWKLAQLYEMYQFKDKALFTYRLALKHHRGRDIRSIQVHYDSINRKDKFVPLEYYYDLVEYRKAIDTLTPPTNVLLNMGEIINDTKYPDYGPSMNVQGNLLVYTKKKKEPALGQMNSFRDNEQLYFTTMTEWGYWDLAQPFSGIINSKCNEGSACISKDGQTMYFARCKVTDYQFDCRDCMGSCDLYVTTWSKEDSNWTYPKNLGVNVNTVYWDSQPMLSHSEDTLFFASDRIGGFGMSDIWYTVKQPDGSWSKAHNMGPIINTRGNDLSPFYHPKYHVLYFSSNGHVLNFGNMDEHENVVLTYDIFKSRLLENRWQEPRNIGPLVNGAGNEYYFTIDNASKNLFYAKSELEDLENLDLYSFPLPMEAQPTAYTRFKGKLTDSLTGEPFKGIVSVIDLDNGIEVAPKYMHEDGTFEFDLIPENQYLLVISGDDFFRVEERFRLSADTSVSLQTSSIKYNRWKFQSLEFENNSAQIKTEMEEDLNKVVDFMLDHPYFKLKISGHTDSDGDPGANKRLSQSRADAIREYIIQKGQIDPTRIEAIGYGSDQPIVTENSIDAKRINRRVEFEIIKPTEAEMEEMRQKEKEEREENKEEELLDEF